MKTRFRRTQVSLSIYLCVQLSFAHAGDGTAAKTLSVLAIGNSFTKNATAYLPALVEASPHNLVLKLAAIGGGPLDRHWKAVEVHEADPKAKEGRIYANLPLKHFLIMRSWDYVTIQQRSYISTDIETYRPYAEKLAGYIRKHAPTAELVIHQTWAYRADDPRFKSPRDSQENMYKQITFAYTTIAKELSVTKIIPVGRAFQNARAHPDWQFVFPDPNFDYKKAVEPALPHQNHSLNVGWRWKDGKLRLDGHHANIAGSYLGAAVWYEFFFGDDVRKIKFVPVGLEESDAKFLREIARQTGGIQLKTALK